MADRQMERKTFPALVTKADEEQGIIETVFAVFGNVDEGEDVVHPGAFTKTFTERGHKVRVLDNHQTDSILRTLGKPLILAEVGREQLPPKILERAPEATGGAFAQIQFNMKTANGRDAFFHLEAGDTDEWSFGYDVLDHDYSKVKRNGDEITVRNLRTLKLYEISPVLWAMNPATATTAAKKQPDEAKPWDTFPVGGEYCVFKVDADGNRVGEALGCHDTEQGARQQVEALYASEAASGDSASEEKAVPDEQEDAKGVSGKTDWPLASRERAWDNAAAEKRVRAWAGAEEEPNAKYRSCHLWYDAGNADNFTAYKLLFCDAVDGKVHAIPRGIFAVAAVLQGARGGADIPAADQAKIKTKVAGYYAKMRSEFDDDGIVPPWDKAADAEHEEKDSPTASVEEATGDDEGHEQGKGVTVARHAETGRLAFTWQDDEGKHHRITESEIRDAKEGRVLSTANAKRIMSAVTALIEALESAGIDINERGKARLPHEAVSISSGTGPAANEPSSISSGTGPGQKTSDEMLKLIEAERERISIAMEV